MCCGPGRNRRLLALADLLGAPVATTLPVRGLFGSYEHDLGVFGTLSTPRAVAAILASDCIIAVGTSLNPYTGGGDDWPYFEDKRVVHCDIVSAAVGAHYPADAGVVADAGTFAETVVAWLREAGYVGTAFREAVAAETVADARRPGRARPASSISRTRSVSSTAACRRNARSPSMGGGSPTR